jgi:hypothetical protein
LRDEEAKIMGDRKGRMSVDELRAEYDKAQKDAVALGGELTRRIEEKEEAREQEGPLDCAIGIIAEAIYARRGQDDIVLWTNFIPSGSLSSMIDAIMREVGENSIRILDIGAACVRLVIPLRIGFARRRGDGSCFAFMEAQNEHGAWVLMHPTRTRIREEDVITRVKINNVSVKPERPKKPEMPEERDP